MAFDEVLAQRIREALRPEGDVIERRMFGGVAFLVHGNMSVSASGQGGMLVRVDPAMTEELTSDPNVHIAVMRGREMPGWLRVDGAGLESAAQLRAWVQRGVAFARSLPTKR
ncbi:MAG TPA: TfoX/Sxy family protein [Candidatus Saccharimonadales bacterium]|nr:TfoX/Sxy family protein [Candidatus Saccharimonadales bacterium]